MIATESCNFLRGVNGYPRIREELRSLLLRVGVEMLIEEGLGTGAEALTFKRVFDEVETRFGLRVSNASVIGRIWDDTAEFQSDVLAAVVSDENEQEIDATVAAALQIFQSADLSTLESRRKTMTELCRVTGAIHFEELTRSRTWQLFLGIWGSAASRNASSVDAGIYRGGCPRL